VVLGLSPGITMVLWRVVNFFFFFRYRKLQNCPPPPPPHPSGTVCTT
jgi:hypothetical protein